MFLAARYLIKKTKSRRAAAAAAQPPPASGTYTQDGGITAEIGEAPPIQGTEAGDDEKKVVTKEETKEIWKYRVLLIAGLFLPFFLNSVDVTIISTALPHIAIDFHELSQQAWIVTAYTIPSTAFIPAFGQLCDVFGRHTMLQFALVLMWIGSALCAGAQTFGMLLVGRAIVGISSAGLLVITTVVLGDKVSLKENALQNTIFSFVGGISFGVGPVIGGYLTAVNWRWCFGLSIPVALLAQVLAYFCLRPILVKAQTQRELARTASGFEVVNYRQLSFLEKLSVVDWEGLVTFLLGCVCVILALSWGGSTYPWNSTQIIVLLLVGFLFLIVFLFIEKGMEEKGWLKGWAATKGDGKWLKTRKAMIPLSLFNSKDVSILAFVNFAGGVALYSMFYFISVYFTIVFTYSPQKSGVQLLLYIPGLGAGVYAAMYMCNVFPAQTFPPLFLGSGLVAPIALGLLTHALDIRKESYILGMMALSGFGNGIKIMPTQLHAIARKPRQLANVVATLQFFHPLGGTFALAVMSSVLNNKVGGTGIQGLLGGGNSSRVSNTTQTGNILSSLSPQVQNFVQNAVKNGVRWAFVAILPIIVLAAVLTFGLGNVNIDTKGLDDRMDEQEMTEAEENHESVWVAEKPALIQYFGSG